MATIAAADHKMTARRVCPRDARRTRPTGQTSRPCKRGVGGYKAQGNGQPHLEHRRSQVTEEYQGSHYCNEDDGPCDLKRPQRVLILGQRQDDEGQWDPPTGAAQYVVPKDAHDEQQGDEHEGRRHIEEREVVPVRGVDQGGGEDGRKENPILVVLNPKRIYRQMGRMKKRCPRPFIPEDDVHAVSGDVKAIAGRRNDQRGCERAEPEPMALNPDDHRLSIPLSGVAEPANRPMTIQRPPRHNSRSASSHGAPWDLALTDSADDRSWPRLIPSSTQPSNKTHWRVVVRRIVVPPGRRAL